ncbi:MAG: hypothetical protein KTR24_03375 [Saprospiraceae bacterium]|nr:hypothetical protein [Saprospiraceae bacterium]
MKTFTFISSIIFYLLGVGGLFFMIFWMGGYVPPSIDRPPNGPISTAILINLGLLVLFTIQHSGMARKSYKDNTDHVVPKHFQRSVYVVISGALCVIIALFWRPLPGMIWSVAPGSIASYVLQTGFFVGIATLLFSTFLINHFELFGLQQAYLNMKERSAAASTFKEVLLYRFVRHPLYLGFAMILWCSPTMSMTHFMLSLGMTGYLYLGMYLEEIDLVREFGDRYLEYKKRVPQLIPFLKR